MSFIKTLRVESIQLLHADGEVALRGLDKEMVMVGHEAVCVADPVVS